jgi:glutaminase
MQTCGFMMSRVSLPIKWIVTKWNCGGIVALFPKFCGSNMVPKLNKKGNSELGMHALNY